MLTIPSKHKLAYQLMPKVCTYHPCYSIISRAHYCYSIGYYSVLDPGPPAATHTCSHRTVDFEQGGTCPFQTIPSSTGVPGSVEGYRATVDGLISLQVPTKTSSTDTTRSYTGAHEATYFSSHSSIQDPSLAVSIDLSETDSGQGQNYSTPTHIKVTIVLATIAGLALIVTFAFCLFRTRRRAGSKRASSGQSKHYNSESFGHSAIQLTTTDVADATNTMSKDMPPPRLQNRRYLPPLPKLSRTKPSKEETNIYGETLIPDPLTINRQKLDKMLHCEPNPSISSPLSSAPTSPQPCLLRDRDSATWESIPDTPTSSSWTAVQSPRGSGGTGTWPPRRHRAKGSANSSIPGSPGPPPDRALPSTPPKSPIGLFHRSQDSGATDATLYKPSTNVPLSQESQDLCELTEACANESHHSWGSWGTGGGGGPGVATTLSKKGANDMRTPLLEEADLEKMGGQY
jgi:hypothetical protein